MSEFSQIMVEVILTAIFGVWVATITKMWENGSRKTKMVIVTVSVIAFLCVIGLAGYNGWISFPKIEPVTQQMDTTETVNPSDTGDTVDKPMENIDPFDTADRDAVDKPIESVDLSATGDTLNNILNWLLKIVGVFIILIFSSAPVFILWLLLVYCLNEYLNLNEVTCVLISGVILLVVLPVIEYSIILHVEPSFAGLSSISVVLLIICSGIYTMINDTDMDTSEKNYLWIGVIFIACLSILVEYEISMLLATGQFVSPLGAFGWIANVLVDIFS